MAITKSFIQDIIAEGDGPINIRTVMIIEEDGDEIFRRPHRRVITPDTPQAEFDALPARVKAIAQASWTAAVLARWEIYKAKQEALDTGE